MSTKQCTQCLAIKDLCCFSSAGGKYKRGKCKECEKLNREINYKPATEEFLKKERERGKRYYRENRDKVLLKNKEYNKKNKKRLSVYKRLYDAINHENIINKNIKYREKNKEKRSKYNKKYRLENYENYRYAVNKRERMRRKIDPQFRLRKILRVSISKALIKNNSFKNNNSILKYLPYTMQELKQHFEFQFEPWMNWDNYGSYNIKTWNDQDSTTWRWQIDHIIPHSKFKYKNMLEQQFLDCWALSNLRPLSAKQNLIDGARK